MRTRWVALLISFTILTSIASADEMPQALRRKADGVVVGVGYTDFSGVANLSDYDVVPIAPEELDTISQQLYTRRQQERAAAKQARGVENRAKAKALQQKLGLTTSDLADLKAILVD